MEKIFLVTCLFACINVLALSPSKEYSIKPDEYGMTYEEVNIPTTDDLQLKGWYFKAPSTSYKIMIISDDGDGNMADMIELVSYFLSLEYHVLTYDYRGYGESSDFKINKMFYIYSQFEADLNSVIEYVKKNYTNIPKINLYGMGIGAGLSIAAGVNNKIEYIIADSPYSTLAGIQQKIKEVKFVDVKLPLGYNKVKLEPQYALESKTPNTVLKGILYIIGGDDMLYTEEDIKELVKLRKDISKVHTVKGATCSNTFLSDKEKYFLALKNFLKE